MKVFIRCLLLAFGMLILSPASFAGIFVSVNIAPPPLPVYEQPEVPGDDYIWAPGYWAFDDEEDDYYWVPGTWVLAPQRGYLWTPGYWAFEDNFYFWHLGYWGPHVGYYGGINYGYGYFGSGYRGGYWDRDHFRYNRSVNNVDVHRVHNTYNQTVINNVTINRPSYYGGRSGSSRQPTRDEQRAEREHHDDPTIDQMQHERGARDNREQLASVNHGRPPIDATPRSGAFSDREVRPARPVRDQEQWQRRPDAATAHERAPSANVAPQAAPANEPARSIRNPQFGNRRNDNRGEAAPRFGPVPAEPQAQPQRQQRSERDNATRPDPEAQPPSREPRNPQFGSRRNDSRREVTPRFGPSPAEPQAQAQPQSQRRPERDDANRPDPVAQPPSREPREGQRQERGSRHEQRSDRPDRQ